MRNNSLIAKRQNSGGLRRSGRAVLDAKLGENLLQVFVHGARADPKNFADIAIRFPVRDPDDDFRFALRQSEMLT